MVEWEKPNTSGDWKKADREKPPGKNEKKKPGQAALGKGGGGARKDEKLRKRNGEGTRRPLTSKKEDVKRVQIRIACGATGG